MFSPKDATKICKEIEMNIWIISLFLILLGVLLSSRENFITIDEQIYALQQEVIGLYSEREKQITALFPEQVQLYNHSLQFRRQDLMRQKRLLNATNVQQKYALEDNKKMTGSSIAYYALGLLALLAPLGL